jgi:hypothetical protein
LNLGEFAAGSRPETSSPAPTGGIDRDALSHARVFVDHYTRFGDRGGQQAVHGRPPAEPTALLVTSSLVYDRYVALGGADLQPEITKARAASYGAYFAKPYLEVSTRRPAFAFFNPVFRIVALNGDALHLQRLAAALRASHPNLSVSLINAKARLP